ncbi:MAG: TIGR02281 family clan AA aspartic protease [Deltaproteobacteria bacterium]|nr:TIGR02281 family clan AA aspartic protease [Deltaproteobacteria bacterium]
MSRRIGIVCIVLSLWVAAPSVAEIYKWVDASGRMHFTTDLTQVPAGQRRESERGAEVRSESDSVQFHSNTGQPPARRGAPSIQRGRRKTYTVQVPPGATSMHVMVELNDRVTAPFIIDTGASDVVLPKAVADELGIETDADTLTLQYRTANGLIESPVVTLDSVNLGGARVEGVLASISSSLQVGLLGLSYFNHFQYEIDAARGLVHLTPNGVAESGAVRGGRSEAQWRSTFRSMRQRLERLQEEIERTPSSRSRKKDGLEEQRGRMLGQLGRLEAEADHAKVPYGWRD